MKFKVDLSKLKNLDLSLKSFKLSKSFKKKPNFFDRIKLKNAKASSLNLSKRDFILLGVLVLGLEGYGLYNIFLEPKWQEYSSMQTRYVADQVIAANFEKDMAQKDNYLENLKLLDYKLGVLTEQIPTEIPQEEIVLTLNKLATTRELDLGGIAFSTISTVSKEDFAAGKTSSDQPQNATKGTTPTSADDGKSSNSKPKLASNMVLVEDVDIAFSGNYGALYNFISDLENSDRKIIVKDLSMTRGAGDLLKGALKVQYVGYVTPEDKSTYSLDTPPVSGKVSPFLAYPGFEDRIAAATVTAPNTGSAPVKTYNPDFLLLLNTYDDNAPKIIMGDYNKNGTELYSNTNDSVRGKLSISGNQDNMTYSYSLGGATQTKKGKLLIDGGKIQLAVSSLPRKDEQDKVSLTLDVDNKTDFPLEITVINDDKQAPRFNLGTRLGSVTVK